MRAGSGAVAYIVIQKITRLHFTFPFAGCMAVVRYQCPNETDTGAGADDEPWTCPGFEFPIRGSWEQRYGEPKGAASELPAASSDAAGTPLPAATSSAAAGAPLPAVAWALAALALACSCALL